MPKTKKGVIWHDISEGMQYPVWYVAVTDCYKRFYHVFDTKKDAIEFIRSLDNYLDTYTKPVHLDCIDKKENISRDSLAIIDHRA